MITSLHEAKDAADRLIARLNELGVSLKRTQAYEGLAAVENFSDWNKYRAYLERGGAKPEHGTPVPALGPNACFFDVKAAQGEALYPSDHHHILLMRPGEGKSSMMLLLFADAVRVGRGVPIWINCYDPGAEPADPVMKMLSTLATRIDILYDTSGLIDDITIPENTRALWFNLVPSTGTPDIYKHERTALTNAFFFLITHLRRLNFPELPFIGVDEFHRLDDKHGQLFPRTMPRLFDMMATRIMIATQWFPQPSTLDLRDYSIFSTPGTVNAIRGWNAQDFDKMHMIGAHRDQTLDLDTDFTLALNVAHLVNLHLSKVITTTTSDSPRVREFFRILSILKSESRRARKSVEDPPELPFNGGQKRGAAA
jgi:hypothetical protein